MALVPIFFFVQMIRNMQWKMSTAKNEGSEFKKSQLLMFTVSISEMSLVDGLLGPGIASASLEEALLKPEFDGSSREPSSSSMSLQSIIRLLRGSESLVGVPIIQAVQKQNECTRF